MWPFFAAVVAVVLLFLLTHPVWDVTFFTSRLGIIYIFLLTHPVWDVTSMRYASTTSIMISTHTSRVGCDSFVAPLKADPYSFYSHIPCGMWHRPWQDNFPLLHFYSHIPCGMWQQTAYIFFCKNNFYSHIPCGMWHVTSLIVIPYRSFLLTHPVWDVTDNSCNFLSKAFISTHTSRVGCDEDYFVKVEFVHNFYSHIPCGMWRRFFQAHSTSRGISTHTSRVGCDKYYVWNVAANIISTHTSRVGCDVMPMQISSRFADFYSHIPCGMWLSHLCYIKNRRKISTHTSRVGCD